MTELAFDIERVLETMRPRLHRYCARMVGSVIDGEDVLQDALIMALQRWPADGTPRNPGAWITTTAHHKAIDRIRRNRRIVGSDEMP